MARDGPLSKEKIELLASQIVTLINQTYPNLSGADTAALMGYSSAFLLNSANPDSLFKVYGRICFDILNGDPNGNKAAVPGEDGDLLGQPKAD